MFNGILAKEPVNTGRQIEFDYLKGIFLFAIFFIHAFQVAGAGLGTEAAAYKVIYMVGSMSGAAIFIFTMGLGSRYSKASIGDMVRSGRKLFGYQYLNNIAYFVSAALPLLILQLFTDMSEPRDMIIKNSELYLFYINIFFLSGGIYLILALMRWLKAPIWLYVMLGIGINTVSPVLVGLNTGFPLIDYVLGGFFGGSPYASFSILNYLPYALLGVGFGEALKRAADKKRFYLLVLCFSLTVTAVFCLWVFKTYPGFDSLYEYMRVTYTQPDFMRTIANTAVVLALAGLLYFANGSIAKCKPISNQLLYFNKHISKYYAIHPTFFFLAWGFHLYKPFDFAGCCILFVLGLAYTEALVRLYNRYMHIRKPAVLSLCIVSLITVLGFYSPAANAPVKSAHVKSGITVAIVPKSLDNPIFLDAKTGGEDKAAELGIKVEWAGSETSDAAGQVAVMEDLITKGVDGILISCNDAAALSGVIDKAVEAGIVVATFDSDSPDSKRSFYIGSDNYGIGQKCAEYINELIPGGGKIAVLTGILGAPNLEARINGLKENLNENLDILPIQSGDDDIQKSVEVVNAFTAANPDLAGWAFVGGWPFNAEPDALTELKAFMDEGGVCVSVDTLYPMLQFVKLEMAQVLIGQNYYKMGGDGIQYIYDIVAAGQNPSGSFINTGYEIVDKDNVDEALKNKTPY